MGTGRSIVHWLTLKVVFWVVSGLNLFFSCRLNLIFTLPQSLNTHYTCFSSNIDVWENTTAHRQGTNSARDSSEGQPVERVKFALKTLKICQRFSGPLWYRTYLDWACHFTVANATSGFASQVHYNEIHFGFINWYVTCTVKGRI